MSFAALFATMEATNATSNASNQQVSAMNTNPPKAPNFTMRSTTNMSGLATLHILLF